jgi:hypothetical protein
MIPKYGSGRVRQCALCKDRKETKGGTYIGPFRKFICKECKEKREKRNEDRT